MDATEISSPTCLSQALAVWPWEGHSLLFASIPTFILPPMKNVPHLLSGDINDYIQHSFREDENRCSTKTSSIVPGMQWESGNNSFLFLLPWRGSWGSASFSCPWEAAAIHWVFSGSSSELEYSSLRPQISSQDYYFRDFLIITIRGQIKTFKIGNVKVFWPELQSWLLSPNSPLKGQRKHRCTFTPQADSPQIPPHSLPSWPTAPDRSGLKAQTR